MCTTGDIRKGLIAEGVSAVGITSAEPVSDVEKKIRERETSGQLAGMAYLSRTSRLRTIPSLHLDGARSIVCTAWSYSNDIDGDHLARYAQHVDYHEYILEKMRSAWRCVANSKAEFFVDSKPLAEKAYASRAGLGWIGKNTLLINPRIGSFFCLGLIVTDLELAPDNLQKDMCGDCLRCIEACPTRALVSPGVLDCRRCISYLTTEHKGEIPEELRSKMGGRIFGCDLCQEVCPYNQDAEVSSTIPLKCLELGDMRRLLTLTEEGFRKMFYQTTVVRIGRGRFLRNVAVALGNKKDKASIPFLLDCLQDPDPLIRNYSKWAIQTISA